VVVAALDFEVDEAAVVSSRGDVVLAAVAFGLVGLVEVEASVVARILEPVGEFAGELVVTVTPRHVFFFL
jgi:hypothetical protein